MTFFATEAGTDELVGFMVLETTKGGRAAREEEGGFEGLRGPFVGEREGERGAGFFDAGGAAAETTSGLEGSEMYRIVLHDSSILILVLSRGVSGVSSME